MAKDLHRQHIFKEVDEQAANIRKDILDSMYYGIPIQDFPNQEDVFLVIAYNLKLIKDLATKVEMPEEQTSFIDASENKRLYPNYWDAGGEY